MHITKSFETSTISRIFWISFRITLFYNGRRLLYTYLLFPFKYLISHEQCLSVLFYIDHTENSNICINPFQEEIVNWSGIEHLKDDVVKNNLAKNLLDSG